MSQKNVIFLSEPHHFRLLFFLWHPTSGAQTIILRGANDYMLDEIERSLHDSLSIVKRTLESKKVVPGGGAVEAALCIFLEVCGAGLGECMLVRWV